MKRLCLALGLLVALVSPAWAASGIAKVGIDVSFDDSGQASVTYTIDGKNNGKVSEVSIPVVGRTVDDLSATVSGDKAGVETEVVEANSASETGHTKVVVSLPSSKQADTASWQVKLTYTTNDLYYDAKSLKSITIPALDYGSKSTSESVSVTMPLDLGLPVALGLEPSDSTVSGGKQSYVFNSKTQREKSIVLEIGTQTVYRVNQTHTLKNGSWWWQTMTVAAPPDTNQQKVFIESISPKPTQIRLDRDGNVLLSWRVGPKKTINADVSSLVMANTLNYNLTSDRPVSEVPDSLADYIVNTAPWNGGAKVEADTSVDVLKQIYDKHLGLVSEGQYDTNRLIADLRASGLPARSIDGLLVHNGDHKLDPPMAQQWVEVYIPGSGWLSVNPVVGQNYTFGITDGFAIATKVDGLGLQISDVDTVSSVEPVDNSAFEDEPNKPSISQAKFMLLPGVSLSKTKVSMPAGVARDGVGYSLSGANYRLGSLAPLQEVTRYSFALGSDSWSTDTVAVGELNGDELNVLAEANSSLNWWPAVATSVAIIALTTVLTIWRRRRNAPIIMSEGDEYDDVRAEDLLRPDKNNES